jgi:hypothetical protein
MAYRVPGSSGGEGHLSGSDDDDQDDDEEEFTEEPDDDGDVDELLDVSPIAVRPPKAAARGGGGGGGGGGDGGGRGGRGGVAKKPFATKECLDCGKIISTAGMGRHTGSATCKTQKAKNEREEEATARREEQATARREDHATARREAREKAQSLEDHVTASVTNRCPAFASVRQRRGFRPRPFKITFEKKVSQNSRKQR